MFHVKGHLKGSPPGNLVAQHRIVFKTSYGIARQYVLIHAGGIFKLHHRKPILVRNGLGKGAPFRANLCRNRLAV